MPTHPRPAAISGDSGGAWVHQVQGGGNGSAPGNRSEWVLSGVIHGGEGDGAHRRGVGGSHQFPEARKLAFGDLLSIIVCDRFNLTTRG